MAIAVKFYNFSKKEKSTKQPTGGTTFNCNLKDNSGILKPIIELDTGNPSAYNYAYIAAYGRYYFVGEWVYYRGVWTTTLKVDVMASWKSTILNTNQYVLRSAVQRNGYIQDSNYPMSSEVDVRTQYVSLVGNPFFTTQTFIIAISNNSTPKINGVQYLACTAAQMNGIINGALNPRSTYWDPEGTSGIADSTYRAIVNPLQYIGDSYMIGVPVDPSCLEDVDGGILTVGSWTLPYQGSTLKAIKPDFYNKNGIIYHNSVEVELQAHPQASSHGDWLNAYPFTSYTLYAGPFGSVSLDTSILTRLRQLLRFTIVIDVSVDFKGKACLLVKTKELTEGTTIIIPEFVMNKQYADVSVPITMTQTKNERNQWYAQGIGTIGSFISGNIGGGLQGIANLNSSRDMLRDKQETKGIQGSTLTLYEKWSIQSEYHKVVCNGEIPVNIIGYPLCEVCLLSDLTGFCQTSKPWLDIDCYDSEYSEIISIMTEGFFIE